MAILELGADSKVPRLDFELVAGCDHKCAHCYNVWYAEDGDVQAGYHPKQLKGDAYLAMMDKAITQSGCENVTITGGEPLLRKDALAIIEKAASLAKVQIITNGSHVTEEVAGRLAAAGVLSVQLTLLSADPVKHDLLKGATCFDDTVRAAVRLREAGVNVQVCFVAMKQNWMDFAEVMELCYVLGVQAVSYNRMSPTGGAIHHIERLLPEVEQIQHNLDTAERLGPKYGIRVATAMPIPPCIVRIDRYEWVQFGFCSTGTYSPNVVVDPEGNLRSCNLSSHTLGNIAEQDWPEAFKPLKNYQQKFKRTVPDMCRGCMYETSCQGGCKESAYATFGSLTHPEPLLYFASGQHEIEQAALPAQFECPGAEMGSG